MKKKRFRLSIAMIIILVLQLFHSAIINQATGIANDAQKAESVAEVQQEDADKNTNAGEGNSETYVYDKLNRLTKVIYANGSVITYSYDKNGNITETKVVAATPTATLTVTTTPTITPVPTKPPEENTVEVFYCNDNWNTAYIHYKVGNGSWTEVPGEKMSDSNKQEGYTWKYTIDLGEATGAEVCFNDGNDSWDSRNGENYKVYQGIYGVKEGNVTELKQATETPTPSTTVTPSITPTITPTVIPIITEPSYQKNTVEVFYCNDSWNTAYIHYKVGDGSWTEVPGEKMSDSNEQEGYTWKYTIDLGEATGAEVCFNDGNGNWDSKYEANYKVYQGVYGVKEGNVTELEPAIDTPTPTIAPTITPAVTEPPYTGNIVEVFYANTNWSTAYVHYKAGNNSWTEVPGEKMDSSSEQEGYTWKYVIELGEATEAQVCFNDGNGNWDSQNAANYTVYQGAYGIKEGKVHRLNNTIELYYSNGDWASAYIHYKIGNGNWTELPGVQMENSNEKEGYQWKYAIDLGNETEAEVCFNNGTGNWDSKNATNYVIYAGIYGIKDETVYELE